MAGIAKPEVTQRGQPEEEAEGALRARAVRATVAAQSAEHILEADLTGSRDYTALRVRNYAAAQRSGDQLVVRAALLDLIGAAAAEMVHLDLKGPPPSLNGHTTDVAHLIRRAGEMARPSRGTERTRMAAA